MNKKTEIAPGVKVTDAELAAAKKEGALDAVREGAAHSLGDEAPAIDEDEAKYRVSPSANTTFIAPLLNLPVDTLVQRMTNDKVADPIDFETVKVLLHLERSGQNRTNYVKAFMDRIGVDSPYKVTSAGPAYTEDATAVTAL